MPRIPPAPLWLGLAGLLPFAAAAAGAHLLPPDQQGLALRALLAYGAVILSFLGGVRWGLAIRDAEAGALLPRLAWSVTPSLLGWVALLLPAAPGLALLAAGFAAALLADLRASEAPGWYRRLRLPLSLGAILATTLGLLA
jgi:hypothetical protein